jgi:hypothetical protein
MNDGLAEVAESFERNPSRVAKTVSFSTRIKSCTRMIWHCGRRATSGSGLINEVRLILAPGDEDGVSSLHIAIFVQLKARLQNAIVDNTVGGYISPYDISETRSEKPQGS